MLLGRCCRLEGRAREAGRERNGDGTERGGMGERGRRAIGFA